jgi:hypothetical protein
LLNLYLGADIGRSTVKNQYGPGEKDVIMFSSHIMPRRERIMENDGIIDPLKDLEVDINGRGLFVGDLARRMGGSKEYGKDKADHQNTLDLLLTAIALSPNVISNTFISPRVVIGLPIIDYARQAGRLESNLNGDFEVLIPGVKQCTISLRSENTIAYQECVGALWDLILDETGQTVHGDLLEKRIGFVDVGFKTVNFFRMVAGVFDEDGSGTLEDMGMADALRRFKIRICQTKSLKPNEIETMFPANGKKEMEDQARKIEGEIKDWWPDHQDMDEIYFCGGGALAIYPYLKILSGKLHPHPQTANANGFRKVATKQFGG